MVSPAPDWRPDALLFINAIGVDEIQYSKGHELPDAAVYQIDPGMTAPALWIGREERSFQGFFTYIGDELASKIVFVCSNMWQPYLKVIRERCSQALHMLDRFHMVAKMNLALDDVARRRVAPHDARGAAFRFWKKSRWLRNSRQGFERRTAFPASAHHLRRYRQPQGPSGPSFSTAFQQLWDYNSPAWAGKFLDEWCHQTVNRIEPMKIGRYASTANLILNYFDNVTWIKEASAFQRRCRGPEQQRPKSL